ncbi:MAG TPA: hypothetical protein VKT80_03380, partial [Chloroflexota bacterium]|nr:hypothetical protein [Chloroflexota bacterium]
LTDDDSPIVEENLWAFGPAWSPDGSQLAYMTDRGHGETGVIDLGIWRMTLATKQARQLSKPRPYSGGDADPAWRPGHPNQLVYTRYFYTDNASAALAELVLLDTSTGNWVELTPPTESSFHPAWSPQGDRLAFVKRATDRDDLYVMPVAETPSPDSFAPSSQLLTGVMAQPVWSPTGDQILFMAESGDTGFDLWIVSVTTGADVTLKGKPVQVTNHGNVDATSRPSWIR